MNATLFAQLAAASKDTLLACALVAYPGLQKHTKAAVLHTISAELEMGNGTLKTALRNNGFKVD